MTTPTIWVHPTGSAPSLVTHYHYCTVFDCGRPTRGGKPYCPRHFLRNPYARDVVRTWEEMKLLSGDSAITDMARDASMRSCVLAMFGVA